MSQVLSNLSVYCPLLSSTRARKTGNYVGGNFSQLALTNGREFGFSRRTSIKAMVEGSREDLDYLQRPISKQQQSQPRRRPAPIGLWDMFPTARTVQQMMETMERIMEDPLEYSGGWPSPLSNEAGGYSRGRAPSEIKESEGEYKMRFDMPGMTKEDVKMWVEEKMLVVKAEKVPKKNENMGGEKGEGEEEDWSAKSYGRYSSRIALPENIQFEKIKAEVKDGVLYITIPKAVTYGKVWDINVQ